MKIAIQGHPTRGKEVIQILESLGGINIHDYLGSNDELYYEIYGNSIICLYTKDETYKYYTLEEFEKEFPFKVGDLCIYQSEYLVNITVKVLRMIIQDNDIVYEIGPKDTDKTYSGIYRKRDVLKPYEEMKEERNVKLTLDKAKEWYNKGGELKEIALQAFTENELNPLPRSWDEFVESTKFTFNCSLEYINGIGHWSNGCLPNKSIGESSEIWGKYLALFQLEQLRNFWIQNRTYKWDDHSFKYQIKFMCNRYEILALKCVRNFLTFPTKEMAEEFLECFRDLIEKAKDLI